MSGTLKFRGNRIAQDASDGLTEFLIGTDYGHADTSTELEAPRLLREREDLADDLVQRIVDSNPRKFYAL